jgi:GAF domain-containing protein
MAETGTEVQRLTAELAAVTSEVDRLKRQSQEELASLNQLIRISTQLNSTLKLSDLLRLIMGSARELFRAEACSVALQDEETGELVLEVSVGEKSEEVAKQRIPRGQGIAGHVVETGEPMIINSVKDSPFFYERIDQSVHFQTRNMLALPLKIRERTIGVVEIINTQGRDHFEEKDLKLATALTSQAAVAIDNATLYQKLADALITSRMSYRL